MLSIRQQPEGDGLFKNHMFGSRIPFARKPREAVSYIRYGRAAGEGIGNLFYTCKKKSLFLPALPIALVRPVRIN